MGERAEEDEQPARNPKRESGSPEAEDEPPWITAKRQRTLKRQAKKEKLSDLREEDRTSLDRVVIPVKSVPVPKRSLQPRNKFLAEPESASSSSGLRPKQEDAKEEIKKEREKPKVIFDDDDF